MNLKDEICLIGLKTFEQVIQVIEDYMYYYNNKDDNGIKAKWLRLNIENFYLRVNCTLLGDRSPQCPHWEQLNNSDYSIYVL